MFRARAAERHLHQRVGRRMSSIQRSASCSPGDTTTVHLKPGADLDIARVLRVVVIDRRRRQPDQRGRADNDCGREAPGLSLKGAEMPSPTSRDTSPAGPDPRATQSQIGSTDRVTKNSSPSDTATPATAGRNSGGNRDAAERQSAGNHPNKCGAEGKADDQHRRDACARGQTEDDGAAGTFEALVEDAPGQGGEDRNDGEQLDADRPRQARGVPAAVQSTATP